MCRTHSSDSVCAPDYVILPRCAGLERSDERGIQSALSRQFHSRGSVRSQGAVMQRLAKYREKRHFDISPEPKAGRTARRERGKTPALHFVVPLHPARDRKSVVSGKSRSVRVDFGGRRVIKKKK